MKVEVAVLGSPALILNLIVVSLDVKHREKSPYMNVIRAASRRSRQVQSRVQGFIELFAPGG